MPGANICMILCPLLNSSIEESEKYRLSKTTCSELCHVQNDYATKTSSENYEEKKLCKSRTTLRNRLPFKTDLYITDLFIADHVHNRPRSQQTHS